MLHFLGFYKCLLEVGIHHCCLFSFLWGVKIITVLIKLINKRHGGTEELIECMGLKCQAVWLCEYFCLTCKEPRREEKASPLGFVCINRCNARNKLNETREGDKG